MVRLSHITLFLLCSLYLVTTSESSEFSADQLEFFERKIRPVLSNHCYKCHSADAKKLKAGLQLDHRHHILAGGDSGSAIEPGNPEASLLLKTISYELPDLEMPPKGKLGEAIVKDFKKWIADGAAWPNEPIPKRGEHVEEDSFDLQKRYNEHWSWRKIEEPTPPEVENVGKVRTTIDRFILFELEKANLKPALPADKEKWIRRAYFDLIGLPPTPSQVETFVNDESPDSYAKLVDELLDSPHFGEKWARHWMDLVRYAETYGHEFDYPIDYAFEYRDYLIRAFNSDLAYDQFVIEHIAGDLVQNPRRHPEELYNESILGTAFWYLHEATHAPTDVLQDEADHMDNQIDVFGKSFLGLTISCARCHDHKFDAISTKDYYALTAYLHSSCRQEYPMDPGRVRETTVSRLEQLQKLGMAELGKISDAKIDATSPGNYFLAAAEMMQAEARNPAGKGDPWAGVVFEDFDSGTYERWKVEGKAFGKVPANGNLGSQKLEGDFGKGLANSYLNGDSDRGTLTSETFSIEKPFLNFVIAGGDVVGLSFEVVIDGKAFQSARGNNSDKLIAKTWDLSSKLGKSAHLKIVDNARGGWGHIVVDRIVFSDFPAAKPDSIPVPPDRDIEALARQKDLDPPKLKAWARIFSTTEKDINNPNAFFAAAINDQGVIKSVSSRRRRATEMRKQFESASIPIDLRDSGWSTSGFAFRKPAKNVRLSFEEDNFLTSPGTISSGQLGDKQNGTLRSPTIEIEKPRINILAKSKNLFARVVPDNYHMAKFSSLLFRGTIEKNVDSENEFKWFSFGGNLDKYLGHKAYLEFVDKGGAKVDIAEIRMSDAGPPPLPPHPVVQFAANETCESLQDIAENLDRAWHQSWSQVRSGQADRDSVEFLNWMANNVLFAVSELSPSCGEILLEAGSLQAKLPKDRYAVAMAEGTPESTRVYIRGSYRNLGETVSMRNLTALGGKEGDRLELARQLVSSDNPLVARVMVNRIWHHLFGRGLVPSVDDFGPMGQEPSHPHLLDWLASDFVGNGWSVKHVIRQIMLSNVYLQDSLAHPDNDASLLATEDPGNILLHRMPVRRLPAEAIRDSILFISGRLDPKLYGPSIPTHRTEFMTGRGGRGSGPLDGAGRRSVYGAVYRNFLSPLMLTFDQPNPFGPKGRRSVSNVPAQSLALMNDPFVIEQARLWARKDTEKRYGSLEERLVSMYRRALGTDPDEQRLAVLKSFLEQQSQHYGMRDERAWADLAHVMINLKDFIFVR